MNRREFVKKTALVGVAGICLAGSLDGMTAADPQPELIVAQGGEPEELLKAALTAFGGLGKLVKPGMTVMVKANFSWYGPPEKACDTNPDLLAALVKVCLKAGARRVRAMVSEAMRKEAPSKAEAGRRRRWSGPKSNRTEWGTIRPTKPINPHTETEAAVINEARK